MKKRILSLMLVFCMVFTMLPMAFATEGEAPKKEALIANAPTLFGASSARIVRMSVKNETGSEITKVYANEVGADTWGEPQWTTAIPNDGVFELVFTLTSSNTTFEIKVVWNGGEGEPSNIELGDMFQNLGCAIKPVNYGMVLEKLPSHSNAASYKISGGLDLSGVSADVDCTSAAPGNSHNHIADSTPCWEWDNTDKTLTLHAADIDGEIKLPEGGKIVKGKFDSVLNGAVYDGTTPEQFKLTTGETYYFDLSGELGTVTSGVSDKIGTINAAVPDLTLHYVPFTYAGTVNAYSLESSSSGNTGASAAATASDRSLFVANYNVSHSISWNELAGLAQNGSGTIPAENLIFGKTFDKNYKLRSLSAGSNSLNGIGSPAANEWDSILKKSNSSDNATGWIKNWSNIFSLGQDSYSTDSEYRALRGSISAAEWLGGTADNCTGIGWRPALEVLSADTLGSDGLKAVTLDLNGGSFNSESSINIVCAGDSFKAPSGKGLTRPSGNTTDYFKWNTQADGKGTVYEVGAEVPNTVTTLYAQWVDAPTGITTFDELKTAISSATPGDTITLGGDITDVAEIITINKSLTLDLNGKTLSMTGDANYLSVTGGTLTLQDTGTGGTLISEKSMHSGFGTVTLTNDASFVMTSGIVLNNYLVAGVYSGDIIVTKGTGTVTIQGGTLGENDRSRYGINNTSSDSAGEITVSGGTIYGKNSAIIHSSTNPVTISGVTTVLTGEGIEGLIQSDNTSSNTLNISGGTINRTNSQFTARSVICFPIATSAKA